MAKRGELMEEAKGVAKRLLGIDLTLRELRLLPYVQHLAVDHAAIDRQKVSDEEAAILLDWIEKDWIKGTWFSRVVPSLEFWRAITEILYVTYVDNDNRGNKHENQRAN